MKLAAWIGILVFLVGLEGLAQQAPPALRAKGDVVMSPTTTFPTGLKVVESEDRRVRNELATKIAGLVAKKDYAGLDALAGELRKSKAQTASGWWHLSIFYHVLTYEYTDVQNVPENLWMERQVFLNKWVQTNPLSITARVALARYWKNYAWQARGLGFANTVKESGWNLFDARLKKTAEILVDARQLQSKCPMWWDTMQFVALGRSWKRTDYEALFNEAVKYEPEYTHFYHNKVMFLLPRWFGKEGDWQKFAAEAADKIGGEAGDILYARIGWRVHARGFYHGFLRDAGYSWPRLKKGLQLIVDKYPDSTAPASELAYLSCQARDRDCAKLMFTKLGLTADDDTWGENLGRFAQGRRWALGQ